MVKKTNNSNNKNPRRTEGGGAGLGVWITKESPSSLSLWAHPEPAPARELTSLPQFPEAAALGHSTRCPRHREQLKSYKNYFKKVKLTPKCLTLFRTSLPGWHLRVKFFRTGPLSTQKSFTSAKSTLEKKTMSARKALTRAAAQLTGAARTKSAWELTFTRKRGRSRRAAGASAPAWRPAAKASRLPGARL